MRGLVLFILFIIQKDVVKSVRLLELRVPTHAAEGGDALLGCQFDMEDDILYSVKWYKDGREFYRYIPKNSPPNTAFVNEGVNVDLSGSSSTILKLVGLTQASAGTYKCEVCGEAPLFDTVEDQKTITIQLLPKTGPRLKGVRDHYVYGDTIAVNCTSSASIPETHLQWLVNNESVSGHFIQGPWTRVARRRPNATETTLQLSFPFQDSSPVEIKCQASIAPLYRQETSHVIGLPNEENTTFDDYDDPFQIKPVSKKIIDSTGTANTISLGKSIATVILGVLIFQ